MSKSMDFSNFYSHATDVYSMEGFKPAIVDQHYLDELGVTTKPSEETLQKLIAGSRIFMKRMEEHTVIPVQHLVLEDIDPESVDTEIHNYTGRCPTLTFELNPVKGCNVGCQYCLVTDGVHEQQLIAYENYHLYVRKLLKEMNGTPDGPSRPEDIRERNRLLSELARAIEEEPAKKKDIERQITEISRGKNWNHYYYYSPKTEALQEPTLRTGIAHRILKEFIAHFEEYPDSNARLFIASKAGVKHALIQPIFTPYLTDEHIHEFFDALHEAGIINYKPEFLTACMENLAMLGQWLGYYDKSMEKALYEDYIMPENADHKKQRGRTAPNRALSTENIQKMMRYTKSLGMTTSICYWVRKQLKIDGKMIPIINENGFQCLGYQSHLFKEET